MKQSSLSREREKVDMVQEETDAAANQERLARHQAFAEVLEGKRPMTWTDWALPFEDSRCLTPAGLHVAQWAVSVLERTFGSDFLQRAVPRAHPVFSMGFWPGLNDVAWVYANIFQLAAQIEMLTRAESHDVHLVLLEMSQDLQESRWIHSLLQLELASLGLRAGWSSQFEPKLSTLNSADLCLTREASRILVETVAMRNSNRDRKALRFFQTMSQQLSALEVHYAVHISGQLGEPLSPEEQAQWMQEIEAVAQSVARNGIIRLALNQRGGRLEIAREPSTLTTTKLEGVPVTENGWGRLVARLNDKANQTKGAGPVWVQLEELSGLWQFTPLQTLSLQAKLDRLLPDLQRELAAFPDLAGIILSPAVLWAGHVPLESRNARIERIGGTAVRVPLPGHRVRETIIVTRPGYTQEEARIFADWYEQEATWLDWALEQLGHPPFQELVHEE